jgi:hypothetical protein
VRFLAVFAYFATSCLREVHLNQNCLTFQN